MRGLNGEIVLSARNLHVGKVSGAGYGYRARLDVTIDVQIERLDRQGEYETTDHRKVRNPLDFAITTYVWRPRHGDIVSGGATVEPLGELVTYARGTDPGKVAELASLAEWHLNAMTAACDHQVVVWEDEPYRRPSLELTEPCPVTGYRYGHAWLVRELPEGFTERVTALLDGLTGLDR